MMSNEHLIQKEAAEALLDMGVSVPFKSVRIPFRKSPMVLRMTMRRPCLADQIKIARIYLGMGVTSKELEELNKDGQMKFIAEHGKDISRMVALTMCHSWWKPVWLVAWLLRRFVNHLYLHAAMMKFVLLLGTESFMNIIRSAEMTNPMRLRLSHRMTGS